LRGLRRQVQIAEHRHGIAEIKLKAPLTNFHQFQNLIFETCLNLELELQEIVMNILFLLDLCGGLDCPDGIPPP
jgi:hypothetical protein